MSLCVTWLHSDMVITVCDMVITVCDMLRKLG